MSRRRSLRRLWRSPWVAAAAVLLFASGLAGGGATLASFTAETQNDTSTFAGGWIGSASRLGVTVSTTSGYNGELAWTPATHGLDGQSVYGVDNGTTTTSCPSSGYQQLTTTSATAAGLSDSSTAVDNPRSGVDGHYVCYRIVSTRSGSSWTATSPAAGAVLGLVPTGISASTTSISNGTATITITFNQNVALPAASFGMYVCLLPAQSQIILGDSSCTPTIGTISVPGSSKNNKENDCIGSKASASGNSIVISVLGCNTGTGSAASFSGTATYTAAAGSTVTSSVGSAVQCTTSLCQPTGTFS